MAKKRILLKLGSNTLTKETNHISRGKIEDIGIQIAALQDDYEFIIVSSGAIAAAKQFVKLENQDKDVFVNVGDEVSAGKVVCVIEAMKLFNQIESEISGKIVKILVDDATPVEYDQPLFLVDPS